MTANAYSVFNGWEQVLYQRKESTLLFTHFSLYLALLCVSISPFSLSSPLSFNVVHPSLTRSLPNFPGILHKLTLMNQTKRQGPCETHQCLDSVSSIKLWRLPDMDFMNPIISRSEFIATNTIPFFLNMSTFFWDHTWSPITPQQNMTSPTRLEKYSNPAAQLLRASMLKWTAYSKEIHSSSAQERRKKEESS